MGSAKVTAKTPRRPTRGTPARTPVSKIKTKPNASILNYFKKSSDESLFIGEGAPGPSLNLDEEEEEREEQEEDKHSANGSVAESRFNEAESSVKRRKLIPGPEAEARGDTSAEKAEAIQDTAEATALPPVSKKPPNKKIINNPFLDDSSSDDDDHDCDGDGDEDDYDEDDSGGSTPPTSGPSPHGNNKSMSTSTGVRLLREETSGAEKAADESVEEKEEESNKEEPTGDEFGGDDYFLGEEFREMRYMQEQAQLEAEAAGEGGEGGEEAATVSESCPICNGILAGVNEAQATAHVNACLDGNPTPLPAPPIPVKTDPRQRQRQQPERNGTIDGAALGKRFAKTATPRPGQAVPFSLGDDGSAATGASGSAFAKLMSGHAEDAAWQTAAAAETSSRGMPAYMRTCPFYKIMPGFSICVDAFRYGAVEGCKAYFLSHFHSDHYIGLTASWTHGPIFCSKVTGSLVKTQLKTAAKFVVELDFDVKTPVPGTPNVAVTMIPANHCPGSSLFLFERTVGSGKTHRILHCGDFRACPAHIAHPQLRPDTVDAISGRTRQQKIDVCYLDTTYLNPRYSFPPQEDVTRACAELCASLNQGLADKHHAAWDSLLRRREGGAPIDTESVSKFFASDKNSNNDDQNPLKPLTTNAFTTLQPQPPRPRLLVVCGTYSIGKERICKAIAQALHTKIFASAAKMRIIKQLDDPELAALMTSDPREAQVHMQMLMEIRADTLAAYLALPQHRPHFARVVGFRPSGWNYRPSRPAGKAVVNANLPPASVPSAHLLHGAGWRARFAVQDLIPQRGASADAMCFGVPYSEHSSFRELALFVMALRIDKVVPTVNVGSEASRKRMKGWTDRWVAERRKEGLVRVLEAGGEDGEEKGGVVLWDGKDARKGVGVYW
ncbi:DNA repair metallo-beta-lactamase-domain-containing protein [Podospora appendiculata]|uniref:DNA repair metallo-beta-lactamase-domain-containing protein n=1 Tax=Podospora appendiculata TaxID=314037 RepID=A0AAE1CH34_9PEZI|nr:DNA repair metallo-beta-lactamase-domain-containing protein [Podospora appendiculata]